MNKNTDELEHEKEEARIGEEKARLDEQLAQGLITGVGYNKRIIELIVPEEREMKPPIPRRISTLIIVVVVILICAIPAAIYLNWHFYFQNTLKAEDVPDYNEIVSSSLESGPIQINLNGYQETGEYKGRAINITYKAYYDITGVITSIRDYWGFGAYDTLAPRDICLVWGELAARYPSSDMEFYHGERACHYSVPNEFLSSSMTGAFGVTHYGSSLVSNNHLIPSTAEVRDDLMSFSVGDTVRLVGYLVRVHYDGIGLDSSMTRDDVMYDHNSTTCEIIYVTKAEKLSSKR